MSRIARMPVCPMKIVQGKHERLGLAEDLEQGAHRAVGQMALRLQQGPVTWAAAVTATIPDNGHS